MNAQVALDCVDKGTPSHCRYDAASAYKFCLHLKVASILEPHKAGLWLQLARSRQSVSPSVTQGCASFPAVQCLNCRLCADVVAPSAINEGHG